MRNRVFIFSTFLAFLTLMSCSENKKSEIKNIYMLQSRDNFYLNSIAYGIKDEIKSKNFDVNINTYNLETSNLSTYEIASKIKNKKDIILTLGDSALNFAIDAFPTNPIIASGIIDTKTLKILKTLREQNGNISGVYYIADVSLYIEDLLKIFEGINSIGYVEYKDFKYADVIKNRIEVGARQNKIRYVDYTINDILNIKEELIIKRKEVSAIVVVNNIPIASVYEYTIDEVYKNNIAAISFEPVPDLNKPILFSIFPNYYRMGRITADITIEILNGKDIEEIEIVNMTENGSVDRIVNRDIAKNLGIKINEDAVDMLVNKVIEDGKLKSVVR